MSDTDHHHESVLDRATDVSRGVIGLVLALTFLALVYVYQAVSGLVGVVWNLARQIHGSTSLHPTITLVITGVLLVALLAYLERRTSTGFAAIVGGVTLIHAVVLYLVLT